MYLIRILKREVLSLNKEILIAGLLVSVMLLFPINSAYSNIGIHIQNKPTITTVRGSTFYVGGLGPNNHTKIQDAIDNASDGNTVFVYDDSSPYYENLMVNKSIYLIGENRITTIIDSSNIWIDIIYISADWVTITGFTIQNGRRNGIDISSNHNTIINNSFYNNGLYVSYSYHNTIENNTVNGKPIVYLEGESDKIITNAGQIILVNCNNITTKDNNLSDTNIGIELWGTNNIKIKSNDFLNNKCGIYLYESSSNYIMGNTITSNYDDGIYLSSNCLNNIIIKNNISSNDYGIHFLYSSSNIITNNNISNNQDGIYFYKSKNKNIIIDNNIISNTDDGIVIDNTNGNTITGNFISDNQGGISLLYSSSNDVSSNNISNNRYGIGLYNSSNNNITDNNISFNKHLGIALNYHSNNNELTYNIITLTGGHGIAIWASGKNFIKENNISNNLFYGVDLYYSHDNNTFSGNTILKNKLGINFYKSKNNNIIIDNKIISNNEYGVWLFGTSNNNIEGNIISNNSHGIALDYSNNNTIIDNIISNNSGGITITSFSDNSIIYHNNLINNSVLDLCNNIWDDGKYGNYWSDYEERYPNAKPKLLKPWMWNTPYEINGMDSKDNCPLVNQWPKSKSKDIPNNNVISSFPLLRFLERYPLLQSLLKHLGIQ